MPNHRVTVKLSENSVSILKQARVTKGIIATHLLTAAVEQACCFTEQPPGLAHGVPRSRTTFFIDPNKWATLRLKCKELKCSVDEAVNHAVGGIHV